MFKETLIDVENIFRDIAGFGMSYEKFKELCREHIKMKIINIFLLTDLLSEGKYCISNESKNTFIECIPETNPPENPIFRWDDLFD